MDIGTLSKGLANIQLWRSTTISIGLLGPVLMQNQTSQWKANRRPVKVLKKHEEGDHQGGTIAPSSDFSHSAEMCAEPVCLSLKESSRLP